MLEPDISAAADSEPSPDTAPARRRVNANLLPAAVVLACAILLIGATKALNPGSSLVQQFSAVLVTSIFLVVASFGQGLAILLGGIDLSIGVVIGLSAMMISVLTNGQNGALIWAVPATLATCLGIGLVNGIGIAVANVPPFIMTLASSITFFGAGLGFTAGLAQEPVAPALQALMSGRWLGVPLPVWLILGFVIVATVLQNGTTEGRKLYAIGSSPGAARVLGLPIGGLTILAYGISGLCAGLSGLLLAGYSSAATLDMGNPLLLPTIAAVVIGGARVTGGRGIYLGTFAGALFLSALETVITVLSLSQGLRDIIEGAIIVFALVLQSERWSGTGS
ncbi:MAG TPA: ABC transporter permease [Acetobacteraceae bacterium]|nr:ABC transporter permease [Acetobacteraceae bacterium]